MIVYRLSREKYRRDLSGRGAELYGGRWNSKGLACLYTSSSRALCMAEIAVHTPMSTLPKDYMIVEIEVPKSLKVQVLNLKNLPKNWREYQFPESTQKIGDAFIKAGKFPVLEVPSAVVQGDSNFLLNPRHQQFSKLKIKSVEPFSFDERLFKDVQ